MGPWLKIYAFFKYSFLILTKYIETYFQIAEVLAIPNPEFNVLDNGGLVATPTPRPVSSAIGAGTATGKFPLLFPIGKNGGQLIDATGDTSLREAYLSMQLLLSHHS